jgi:hypothetical protein
LLSLFDVGTESIWPRKQAVPLHKSQVRFAVLGRLAFNLRLLGGRQFSTQFARDFLSEITLNGEHVCQLPVVVFRPHVLVVHNID